jgi:hypothetical protein
MTAWYLESKRTESPTEYNVNVLTLASRQIQSPVTTTVPEGATKGSTTKVLSTESVRKLKKAKSLAAETPQRLDSPAKNTCRASRKRYYEEVDYDEDSEEEFKPHMEQDASSSDEGTGAAAITTKATATVQLKKQHVSSPSQAVARAGGREPVEDNSTSSTSVYTNNPLQDLPPEGFEHQMELRMMKMQKKFKLADVEEDTEDEMDEDYLYKGYPGRSIFGFS